MEEEAIIVLIKHSSVVEFLRRPLGDHRWVKKLTTEQIMAELKLLKIRPIFKTDPWIHQLACFYIATVRPDFIFTLDMGLGKTKILLDIITQVAREDRLSHALVTVPRRINIQSWDADIERHSELVPNLIDCEDIEEKWERLSNPKKSDITVIDYPSLHLALSEKKKVSGKMVLRPDEKKVARVQKLYNFVGIDEIHKLSNDESLWFMIMRRMTAFCEFTYGTTGTLFGGEEGTQDPAMIWPQFFLIDRGETFGENKGLFRASFFKSKPNLYGRGQKFTYDPSTSEKLNSMLQHRSLRYDEDEVLDLPKRVARTERFVMAEEQRQHYMLALDGLIAAGGDIQKLEGAWIKMRRIISGYLTWKDEYGDHVVRFKQNPKLDGLERLIDEVGGRSKIIVAYDYVETGKMICERVASMGLGYEWFYGGTKDQAASKRRFEEDPSCRVMVANSEAIGTGNDGLQKVCRYMMFYETPTPPITRKQTIKRIHRPGMRERAFFYDLVMRRSLDGGILASLASGVDAYDSVVNGRRKFTRGFLLSDEEPIDADR